MDSIVSVITGPSRQATLGVSGQISYTVVRTVPVSPAWFGCERTSTWTLGTSVPTDRLPASCRSQGQGTRVGRVAGSPRAGSVRRRRRGVVRRGWDRIDAGGRSWPDEEQRAGCVVDDEAGGWGETVRAEPAGVAVACADEQIGTA